MTKRRKPNSGDPREDGGDPFSSTQFREFARHVREELVPELDSSAITMSLVPRDPQVLDVKYAVELGFSILLDKPLILLVHPGQVLPDHLVRVADRIVEVDFANPEGAQESIQRALKDLDLR